MSKQNDKEEQSQGPLKANPGQEVLAKGWVRTKRGNKQIKFIALNDGSTVNNIQVVADMTNFDEALIARITTKPSQPKEESKKSSYKGPSVVSYELDGRKASKSSPAYRCLGAGHVTVIITVDPSGKVLSQSPGRGVPRMTNA